MKNPYLHIDLCYEMIPLAIYLSWRWHYELRWLVFALQTLSERKSQIKDTLLKKLPRGLSFKSAIVIIAIYCFCAMWEPQLCNRRGGVFNFSLQASFFSPTLLKHCSWYCRSDYNKLVDFWVRCSLFVEWLLTKIQIISTLLPYESYCLYPHCLFQNTEFQNKVVS